jgi:two-component system, sensor histidine kinase PdtaS
MIGSLLALQARRVEAGSARDAVEEAARRVRLVGKIQRTLYDTQGSQRNLSELLGALVQQIVESGQGATMAVRLEPGPEVLLPAEHAIPVALIVSEAVSNALEHGYDIDGDGAVTVRMAFHSGLRDGVQQAYLSITVEDGGNGLPDGFDIATSASLGLRIARSLASGLGGEFSMRPAAGKGTVSELRFPLPDQHTVRRSFRAIWRGSGETGS